MPKAARTKWYAVRQGWDGPAIYDNWDETKKSVSRYRGAEFKSFLARKQAEEWLSSAAPSRSNHSDIGTQRVPTIRIPPKPKTGPIIVIDDEDVDMSDSDSSTSSSTSSQSGMQVEADRISSAKPGPSARLARQTSSANATEAPKKASDVPASPESATVSDGSAAPEVKLSPEQEQVLKMVQSGKSVFFTGSAGTGKSVLLREIIRWCKEKDMKFAVTASTGIAAVNVGGSTLHSWAAIGLGKEPADKLVEKILGHSRWYRQKRRQAKKDKGLLDDDEDMSDYDDPANPRALMRWRQCQLLMIDEISMVDGKLFDKLEYMGRQLRRKPDIPFGGMQLVLSGDFCQLPPVPDKEGNTVLPATFAFDAKSWNQCIGKPVVLKKVFRQKDQRFVNMLNAMRFGNLSPDIIKSFRELSRPVKYADNLEPSELYPTRKEVETANANRLMNIKAKAIQYDARDIPGWDVNGNRLRPEQMERLLDRLVAPKVISLKPGAQVMLIKNIVQGLMVNGTLGRVIDFLTTLEASQRGIKIGIPLGGDDAKKWKGEEEAGRKGDSHVNPLQDIPQELLRSPRKWPVVQFSTGEEQLPMCCVPLSFEVMNADGEVEARRDQVPLILAWALSVHKSQGQTLDRVRVDLTRTFEKGQAYVALSRATNLESLQVKGFDPLKVQAHPRVIEWTRANTDMQLPFPAPGLQDDDAEYWNHV